MHSRRCRAVDLADLMYWAGVGGPGWPGGVAIYIAPSQFPKFSEYFFKEAYYEKGIILARFNFKRIYYWVWFRSNIHIGCNAIADSQKFL